MVPSASWHIITLQTNRSSNSYLLTPTSPAIWAGWAPFHFSPTTDIPVSTVHCYCSESRVLEVQSWIMNSFDYTKQKQRRKSYFFPQNTLGQARDEGEE